MNRYLAIVIITSCLTCFGVTVAHAVDAGTNADEVSSTDVVPTQPGEVTNDDQALDEVGTLWRTAASKDWLLALASFIALMVYGMRRFMFGWVDWFQTRWGGAVFAFVVAGGAALVVGIKGGQTGGSLVIGAVTVAVTAGGVWALRRVPQKKPDPGKLELPSGRRST